MTIDTQPTDPLERLPTESPRAHEAFLVYWRLGADRTLEAVRQHFGFTSARQCERWSAAYAWRARVSLQAAKEARLESQKRAALRAKRRQQLEDSDWELGETLRARAAELAREMPRFLRRKEEEGEIEENGQRVRVRVVTLALNATPDAVGRLAASASTLQHQATDAQRVVEEQLEEVLDRLKDVLSPADYARALTAISGSVADDL